MDGYGCRVNFLVSIVWLACVAMVLGGCATLDKNECLNADWRSIGYEDGAKGYKASRIGSHRKACAKHGIAPDFERYESGRRQGLSEWCTPRNGYRQGVHGKGYNGVCPSHLEGPFVKAHAYGMGVYAYALEIKRQEKILKQLYAELDALNVDIKTREDELISPGVSPWRRLQLLSDIRRLEADQDLFLSDISDMEHTLEDMHTHLALLKKNNRYQRAIYGTYS
jgi:hypothetical protein